MLHHKNKEITIDIIGIIQLLLDNFIFNLTIVDQYVLEVLKFNFANSAVSVGFHREIRSGFKGGGSKIENDSPLKLIYWLLLPSDNMFEYLYEALTINVYVFVVTIKLLDNCSFRLQKEDLKRLQKE